MTNEMKSAPREDDLRQTLVRMGAAWDRADASAFASVFSRDADFVNILGMAFCGREAIAAQHQAIFDTIYRGSHAVFELIKTKQIAAGVAVVQIAATLDAPGGPRPGVTRTIATAVLTEEDERWSIASFQNTIIAPPPSAQSAS